MPLLGTILTFQYLFIKPKVIAIGPVLAEVFLGSRAAIGQVLVMQVVILKC